MRLLVIALILLTLPVNARTVILYKLGKKIKHKKEIMAMYQSINKRTDVFRFKRTKSYRRADIVVKKSNQFGHVGWWLPGTKVAWISSFGMKTKKHTPLVVAHESWHVLGLPHSEDKNSFMYWKFNIDNQILDEDIERLEKLYQ